MTNGKLFKISNLASRLCWDRQGRSNKCISEKVNESVTRRDEICRFHALDAILFISGYLVHRCETLPIVTVDELSALRLKTTKPNGNHIPCSGICKHQFLSKYGSLSNGVVCFHSREEDSKWIWLSLHCGTVCRNPTFSMSVFSKIWKGRFFLLWQDPKAFCCERPWNCLEEWFDKSVTTLLEFHMLFHFHEGREMQKKRVWNLAFKPSTLKQSPSKPGKEVVLGWSKENTLEIDCLTLNISTGEWRLHVVLFVSLLCGLWQHPKEPFLLVENFGRTNILMSFMRHPKHNSFKTKNYDEEGIVPLFQSHWLRTKQGRLLVQLGLQC